MPSKSFLRRRAASFRQAFARAGRIPGGRALTATAVERRPAGVALGRCSVFIVVAEPPRTGVVSRRFRWLEQTFCIGARAQGCETR